MKIASSGIILREDNEKKQILLVKRGSKTKFFPNFWGLPGGKQEAGESLEEIAIREVKEEINLIFNPDYLLYTSENSGFQLNRFMGTWEGSIKIKEDELDGYGWFNYDETNELPIAFDHKKFLEILKEKKFID